MKIDSNGRPSGYSGIGVVVLDEVKLIVVDVVAERAGRMPRLIMAQDR